MRRLFCLPRRPKADCVRGKAGTETPAPNRLDSGYSHNGHLPSQGDSNMANSEDSDKAFAELFELFSRPIKSPQRAYRTYQLKFENGEPVFTLSEADRLLEEVFEEMFGPGTNE